MSNNQVITIGESLVAFLPNAHTKLRYVQQFSKVVVGAESNVAVGLSKLGHPTGWVSKVGSDEFGQFIVRELRAEGVDTSRVLISDEGPSGIMFKQFSANLASQVFYYRKGSAASTLRSSELDWEYLKQARILHLSGITPALSKSCRDVVYEVFAFAKKEGILVCFDPNIRRKLWSEEEARHTLQPLLAQADIVLLGEDEGQVLLQTGDRYRIADILLGNGAKAIGIKRGEQGAYVADGCGGFDISPYPVTVVDTIGAGDAFNAGFLAGILEKEPIQQCGRMGALMGALAVSSIGDVEGLPERKSFDELLQNEKEIDR